MKKPKTYIEGHSTCCNAGIYFKNVDIFHDDYFCKKCHKRTWAKEFQKGVL